MTKNKEPSFDEWAGGLSADERLKYAERSLKGVSNVARFLVSLHETNKIAVYSDALAKQIPASHAANTYNNFTQSLHEIELVRLCSLWDPKKRDAFTIPTVSALIDDPAAIEK